jgi:hypothetical protein
MNTEAPPLEHLSAVTPIQFEIKHADESTFPTSRLVTGEQILRGDLPPYVEITTMGVDAKPLDKLGMDDDLLVDLVRFQAAPSVKSVISAAGQRGKAYPVDRYSEGIKDKAQLTILDIMFTSSPLDGKPQPLNQPNTDPIMFSDFGFIMKPNSELIITFFPKEKQ